MTHVQFATKGKLSNLLAREVQLTLEEDLGFSEISDAVFIHTDDANHIEVGALMTNLLGLQTPFGEEAEFVFIYVNSKSGSMRWLKP